MPWVWSDNKVEQILREKQQLLEKAKKTADCVELIRNIIPHGILQYFMQNVVQWWHYVRKNCGSVSCHLHLGSDTVFLNAHFAAQVSIIMPNNFHTTVTSTVSHTMPSNMTYVSRTRHNTNPHENHAQTWCADILFYKCTYKKPITW